jgi:hypothetical protein
MANPNTEESFLLQRSSHPSVGEVKIITNMSMTELLPYIVSGDIVIVQKFSSEN